VLNPCMTRAAAAGAAALLLLFAAPALAAPAGTVVGVSGSCYVENGAGGAGAARSALQLGAAVQIGDTIDVAADGKLKLRMADGSILAVAPGTRMTVAAYAVTPSGQRQNAQLSLSQGLLHVIDTPTQQAPAKFEVDTAVGAAAVRSTNWLIEATANDQQVSVISGSVVVTSGATGHSVVVPAHETTRVERGHDPLRPRPLSRAAVQRLLGRTQLRRGEHAAAHPPGHADRPFDRPARQRQLRHQMRMEDGRGGAAAAALPPPRRFAPRAQPGGWRRGRYR
jgi:hypothetical protein